MAVEHVVIIGAGPAGLSTAIQLKRYGIETLIFEKEAIGGLLRNANLVENYTGFPGGISGEELVEKFKIHAQRISVKVTYEEVQKLSRHDRLFRVETKDQIYYSHIAVIASGTKPRIFTEFNISTEIRDRIHYEVYPLLDVNDSKIAIVGAGDAAFDYALNLAKNNHVIILNRGEVLKCLPLLWERAKTYKNIYYLQNTNIIHVRKSPQGGLSIKIEGPNGIDHIDSNYLIGAIGRDMNLDFVTEDVNKISTELEKRGVLYYVGDVKNGIYRQTSIAVGDGIRAAMKIFHHMEEHTL